MSRNFVLTLTPLTLALALAGCGGGGTATPANTTDPEDTSIAAAQGGTPEAGSQAGTTSIAGRVADGYIVGATVCVDLNENESCDADEPSAVTTAGGEYSLDVPAGAADKPIVAVIPADAIDEDTGTAVGSELVFSAPAERPEFLSPITTLIQQELKSNPSLEVGDAERTVKSVLGIDEDGTVSLFEDYVALPGKPGTDSEDAERYEYLHDTARVIASMMKDIEKQVETAATDKGLDVAGDPAIRQAVRELVRNEVRSLLPEIAKQVADIVGTSGQSSTDGGTAGDTNGELDPDKIAVDLRPESATQNVDERINAIRNQGEISKADVKNLLTDGVYSIDFDCRSDGFGPIRADYAPEPTQVDYQEKLKCDARYDIVKLNAEGDELVHTEYEYDKESAGWVVADGVVEKNLDLSLVDGKWTGMSSVEPSGAVSFTDDGAAIIRNESGEMRVRAASQVLDGIPVLHHLWDSFASPAWFEFAGPDAVFTADSDAHRLSVEESVNPYVLFNWPSPEFDPTLCSYTNDNCNVVYAEHNGQHSKQYTLAAVQEATVDGIALVGLGSSGGLDVADTIKLTADAAADGNLPVAGIVTWLTERPPEEFGPDPYEPGIAPQPGDSCTGIEPTPSGAFVVSNDFGPQDPYVVETSPTGEQYPTGPSPTGEQYPAGPSPTGEPYPVEHSPYGEQYPEGQYPESQLPPCEQPVYTNVEGVPAYDATGAVTIEEPTVSTRASEWRIITVDGVPMLEIELPLALRHDEDLESEQSLLLIEHDGFVRLGAKLPKSMVRSVTTYNSTAFETMKALAESAMQGSQEAPLF